MLFYLNFVNSILWWNVVMVGDIYRVLSCGGMFVYFEDSCVGNENGKIWLFYEVNLLVMLVEGVGGIVIVFG